MTTQASQPAPLIIQNQGSFAVGGTVITNPGSFNPRKRALQNYPARMY